MISIIDLYFLKIICLEYQNNQQIALLESGANLHEPTPAEKLIALSRTTALSENRISRIKVTTKPVAKSSSEFDGGESTLGKRDYDK